MSLHTVAVIAGHELRQARRNRWFLLFAATFAAVALGVAWLSVTGIAGSRFAGFNRTAASLVNLVVLIVPLMGLVLGATAVAAERERGALLYLLCQPIDAGELVLGKFTGLSGAVLAALAGGFGLAAAMLALRGAPGGAGAYLLFLGLAALLAAVAVSVGLLVSTLSPKVSMAAGLSLFVWLALVLLGDLGLMGTAVALRLEAQQLLFAALANPLQVFKIAALMVVRGGLEPLGPAGIYAVRSLGSLLLPLLVAILLLWIAAPLAAATLLLRRRGAVG